MKVLKTLGVVLAVCVGIAGLLYVAFIIVLFVGLSQWGSNK